MALVFETLPSTALPGESPQWIREDLATVEPELRNVWRLFSAGEGEAATVAWGSWADGTKCFALFRWDQREKAGEAVLPVLTGDDRMDGLLRRRTLRRLMKQTFYDLLKEVTGVHPPWGSLTGIRPTTMIYEQLRAGATLAQAGEHVERLYDVTPEKSALLQDIVAVQQTLPLPSSDQMDVYIGIPFCRTRCAYCSFLSGEIGRGKQVPPYLEALQREMEAGAEAMARWGKRLRAVYVGGGTPTALEEEEFGRLMETMARLFPDPAELTVEAGRPDSLTPGKLQAIWGAGARRISINPQTMNDETLRRIGRDHTVQQVVDAYGWARAAGFRHINMDVIAGLPGEALADFQHTMEGARQLRPESLTVHTLAIKRSSMLHLQGFAHGEGSPAEGMVSMGRETAYSMGMKPYYVYRQKNMAGGQENAGYALPGHACLYNVDIMEETTHILAFGAGGISKRIYPRMGRIERAPNVSNIEEYTSRVEEMIRRKELLFADAE